MNDPRVKRLRAMARFLDNSIQLPMVNYRIGFDGLIGLVPVIGDTLSAAMGGYIVLEAYRLGYSKRTLARMLGNIGLDWLLGLVPLVGDVLDFGYKASVRNLRLMGISPD